MLILNPFYYRLFQLVHIFKRQIKRNHNCVIVSRLRSRSLPRWPLYYAPASEAEEFISFLIYIQRAYELQQQMVSDHRQTRTFTIHSTEGYFDFPLMPSRRAFMFGKTFFIIFPKSAALSGWQLRLSQKLLKDTTDRINEITGKFPSTSFEYQP